MRLAIEMGGDGRKYGVIHKAGCRDLRDGMPLGEATTRTEAAALAEDACNWGYEPDEWVFAPCAATVAAVVRTTHEAEQRHDFETEGRQDQRTDTPCAVCGEPRQSLLHKGK